MISHHGCTEIILSFRLCSVAANRLNRTAGFDFLALLLLVGIFRLLIDDGIAAVVVAFKVVWGGFAAQVAVNALVVHVEFASHVLGILVCLISHKIGREN